MQYILTNELRREAAIKHIQSLDINEPFEIIVQSYNKKRSLPQNKLLWAIYKPLSDYTGYTEEELHDIFKTACIGYDVFTFNGNQYIKPKTSTRLTVKGMTRMLEKIMVVANFLEVTIPIPDQYAGNLSR
jgi:hypothetical protein